MSNTQPPAQFDWATELSDAQGHVTLSEQEAHEIGARLRASHGQAPAGESLRTLKSTTAQAAPGAVAGPSEAELLALVRTFLEREDECRERENDEEDRFTDLERTQYRILRSTAVQALRAALAAAPTTQPAPQQEPVEMPAAIEQMATGRYKVVPSHESMFHRWAVVAGTGAQQLYLGREVECQNMARKFAGAFLDGVYVALRNATPQPSPAAQGDALDAGRWRRLVNASELSFPVATIADDPENGAVMLYGRKALEDFVDRMDEIPNTYDAARAAQEGKSHDN